jgi:hypothetical protein
MLQINVNDTSKMCPTFWEDVKTGTYQKLKATKDLDLLKGFSVLIDTDLIELEQSTSEDLEVALYQCASFIFTQEEYFRKSDVPKSIKLKGVNLILPRKLENMTLEQTLFMRTKMSKEGGVLEEFISTACAVYLQPLVTKTPFNVEEAMALKAEIDELPIEQTFPVGFFFLNRLNNYGKNGMLLLIRLQLTKLMRSLRSRLRFTNSGHTQRWG